MSSYSSIVTETISSVEDRRAGLVNSSLVRPHGKGTGWSTLRVGMRFQIAGNAANIKLPVLFVGLCSGTTAPFGVASSTNCFGLWIQPATSWVFTAASGGNMGYFETVDGTAFSAKKVGSTLTKSSVITLTENWFWPAVSTAATRRCLFVDIIKGSPNYTMSVFFCNGATAAPDVTAADFAALVASASPSATNHVFKQNIGALAFDQSAGTLDCVNVSWSAFSEVFHICDLATVVIA